jgi:hypothetical protein
LSEVESGWRPRGARQYNVMLDGCHETSAREIAVICYNHAEREAVGTCAGCGKPVCPECKVVLRDKVYCNGCTSLMLDRAVAAMPLHGPNWFERHLNWTSVLSLVAAYGLAFITGLVVGTVMFARNPDVLQSEMEHVAFIAGFLVTLGWLLVTNGWVLRRKGQSEWYLLLLLVPFGFLIILGLRNKTAATVTTRPPVG